MELLLGNPCYADDLFNSENSNAPSAAIFHAALADFTQLRNRQSTSIMPDRPISFEISNLKYQESQHKTTVEVAQNDTGRAIAYILNTFSLHKYIQEERPDIAYKTNIKDMKT
ncbi:hypothetical protein [Hoeflea sp.]|uniref:hypothetical protein n=1 Tax=Hoeflea sp. TaxID=1940281 RepID=UPI003748DA02